MTTLSEARKRWPKDDRISYYLALGHDDRGEHAEAANLLRDELRALKPEMDRQVREFAEERERFIAQMQDRNGPAKLEAPTEQL